MERVDYACRSADVIGVGMGQNECVDAAASSQYERHHVRAACIATAPRGTAIEYYPASNVGTQQDRVALADIEDVELDAPISGSREKWQDRHQRQRCQTRYRRARRM